MRVLVACEFSGVVRRAFRELGHDAWSCDIEPCLDGSPFHIQDDVLKHLKDGWDLMIAHPPCTHIALSGARHFAAKIADGRQQAALDFFRALLEAPIEKICVENPMSVASSKIRKYDQAIQPWQFGHEAQKTTWLWLKNLPLLVPTNIVGKGDFTVFKSGKKMPTWYANTASTNSEANRKIRNTTFTGIAKAMAEQWGNKL